MGEQGYSKAFNNKAGQTPKVDGVIIFNYLLLGKMTTQPYTTETERRFKYLAIKDHLFISVDPVLIPKITDSTEGKAWAERYNTVMAKLKDNQLQFKDLDNFLHVLQELMQLFATMLYSHGYYDLEQIKDTNYEQYMPKGVEVDV